MKITVLAASVRLGVTYNRLYAVCMRGDVPYIRKDTKLYIDEEHLPWLEAWLLEHDRLKDKEQSIGKYDIDGRQTLRAMGRARVRESHNSGGQADAAPSP